MIAVSTISLMLPDVYLRCTCENTKSHSGAARAPLRRCRESFDPRRGIFIASNEGKLQFENIGEHHSLLFFYFPIVARPSAP